MKVRITFAELDYDGNFKAPCEVYSNLHDFLTTCVYPQSLVHGLVSYAAEKKTKSQLVDMLTIRDADVVEARCHTEAIDRACKHLERDMSGLEDRNSELVAVLEIIRALGNADLSEQAVRILSDAAAGVLDSDGFLD